MSFSNLDVDSFLHTLAFMNAQSLARIASCCRLGAIAAQEAQRQPALLVVKGTPEQVVCDLRDKLAARPTMAFLQYCSGGEERGQEMLDFVCRSLPPEMPVLGACTESLHCALIPNLRPSGTDARAASPEAEAGVGAQACTVLEVAHGHSDSEQLGLLLVTLPEAHAQVFHIEPGLRPEMAFETDSSEEEYSEDGAGTWEEVEAAEELASRRTTLEITPRIATAEVSFGSSGLPWDSQEPSDSAEVGGLVASEGDVDEEHQATLAPCSEPAARGGGSEDVDMMELSPPPEVIIVHQVGRYDIVKKLQRRYPKAVVIGGVAMGDQVLIRHHKKKSVGPGVAIMAISGEVPLYAMTCPFTGDVCAAMEDVKRNMRYAHKRAVAEEERILGALLFTCNGRGQRMFGRHASDAAIFQAQFPYAQLLGHYAGGEIGPQVPDEYLEARSLSRNTSASGDSEPVAFLSGNSCEQGFTAVYGIFLVPRRHFPSHQFMRAVLRGEVGAVFHEQCRAA